MPNDHVSLLADWFEPHIPSAVAIDPTARTRLAERVATQLVATNSVDIVDPRSLDQPDRRLELDALGRTVLVRFRLRPTLASTANLLAASCATLAGGNEWAVASGWLWALSAYLAFQPKERRLLGPLHAKICHELDLHRRPMRLGDLRTAVDADLDPDAFVLALGQLERWEVVGLVGDTARLLEKFVPPIERQP